MISHAAKYMVPPADCRLPTADNRHTLQFGYACVAHRVERALWLKYNYVLIACPLIYFSYKTENYIV
jgi:hypothetical protein